MTCPGPDVEHGAHRQRHRDRMAADVALHALGLAGRARGVQTDSSARWTRAIPPAHRHARARGAIRRSRGRDSPPAACHDPVRATRSSTCGGGEFRSASASSTSGLYAMTLPPRMPASAQISSYWFRVVDAQCQVVRGEAAEHDRVDRAEARAREHGEHGLGNVRHVDHDAIATFHAERSKHRRRTC